MLQLTASSWTTEASTRERWQFEALTNRKATSSNRDPSQTLLFASASHHFQLSIWIATIVTGDHPVTSLFFYLVALSLYRDKWTTIIRLRWLSQWLVTHGYHLVVTIYLHVAPSTDCHTDLRSVVPVAARGENGREGCEISSLVEYTGLSPCPWLFIMAFPVTPAVLNLSNW